MLDRLGYLVPIDYSLYDPKELEGLAPGMRPKWGVAVADTVAAFVLSYNTESQGKAATEELGRFLGCQELPRITHPCKG